MKRIIPLLILLVVVAAGCSIYHINSEDISADYYPSKKTANDVVYLDAIDRPHEIIAYVTVNAERRQNIDDVITKMKREAAILGGDAITDIKTDGSGVWKKLPAQHLIGNGYVRANFKATVVIFK